MVPRILRTPALLIVLLAACAPAPSTPGSTVAASPSPSAAPSDPPAYPVTLSDDTGRSVTLEAEPERIVSLAPSNTEIVCALDACDLIVGVTDFDDHPPEVADVDKVVTMAQVDVEAVVAVEPDLVIAAGNELTPTAVIEQLTGLGLAVMTLYPESLDEIYADIELVGRALDRDDAARTLVEDMESRVEAVQRSTHFAGHSLASERIRQTHPDLGHAKPLEQSVTGEIPPALENCDREGGRTRDHQPETVTAVSEFLPL